MDSDKIQIEPPSNPLDSSNTETTNISEETPINLYEKYKNKLVLDLEKDIILPKPNVSFDDIVGHESAKNSFMECVILPLLYPQLFVGIRRPINRIWLYGVCFVRLRRKLNSNVIGIWNRQTSFVTSMYE